MHRNIGKFTSKLLIPEISMCGIIGHIKKNGTPDVSAVKSGMAAMQHRGPDGEGIMRISQACLGHRRLSIIDVADSLQPWQSSDGRFTIIFNGEIYNYIELRSDLQKRGFQFRTQGDTEVLLSMFICHGADCLKYLNGMFAFAVWDERDKKLFLARDRLGKKPLYYAITNTGLVFSSEIGALQGFSGIDRTIDLCAVNDFFAHQFIGGDRSIYRGISKLRAGHYLVYGNEKAVIEKYWAPPIPDFSNSNISDLCEEFKALLEDAVRIRLRSDVPLGSFLSGGLDSALIVSCMKSAGADVESFTVGFNEASFDESLQAKASALFFSTQHHDDCVKIDVPSYLNETLNAFGEPFADPSALPMGHLCQHVRQYVTVALSGDGADELFGGYRRYYARKFTRLFEGFSSRSFHDRLIKILSAVSEGESYYGNNKLKQLKLLLRLAKANHESPRDPLAQVFTFNERRSLFSGELPILKSFDYLKELDLKDYDQVSQMMMADIRTYLIDDILVKVDRMSMFSSLEVRSPFLDYRIVEFASRLPLKFKINGSVQKYLIRECYKDRIPKEIIERNKHGFAVPLATWFRGTLKSTFETTVLDSETPEFLNRTEIQRIWNEHQCGRADNGFKLWCLLIFFRWYQNSRQ